MELIEEGIAVEKKFRDKIQSVLSCELSEENKIEKYSKQWELNKPKTVRRMITEFKEDKNVR